MLNKLKEMRESREEGFTLIELLVVIVIIGVLAAIALPIFLNQQRAAAHAAVKNDVRNAVTAVNTMLVQNPTAENTSNSTGLFSTVVNSSPRSDTVNLIVRAEVTGTNASPGGIARWDSYAIKGTTSADSSFWYVFESTTGSYKQSS